MGVVTGTPEAPGAGPPELGSPDRWPARLGALRSRMGGGLAWLDLLGDQLSFYAQALAWTPRAVRRYYKEILRLLAEVSFGSGALALIGGTVGVMIGMTLFTGTVVGLQGYAALNQIGASAFTGFVSAYFNTREIAPLVAGLALSATVGAGFTAQLGSMRINEEVDALEGMAFHACPTSSRLASWPGHRGNTAVQRSAWSVPTRLPPGHGCTSRGSRLAPTTTTSAVLSPVDVLWSFLKVVIFSVVVIGVHCYYGYRASGGPAGVGVAVGRGVRTAIVMINIIDFFLSLAIWERRQPCGWPDEFGPG